jgi:xanthine dehydrogenase YagR molybdenum-binding subunit
LAIDHDCVAQTAAYVDYSDPNAVVSRVLYACANVSTSHHLVRTNEPPANPMRSPGEGPGSFALECALDELAHQIDLDPLELRRRNFARFDQDSNRPWTSNGLLECYAAAARAFGWDERRQRKPPAGRRIGFGMASARYPTHYAPTSVHIAIEADGTLQVACGTQDIGTGRATIVGDLAAAELGWPRETINILWGDTDLPEGPPSVGSMATASIAPAVEAACRAIRAKLSAAGLDLAMVHERLAQRAPLPRLEATATTHPSEHAPNASTNAYGAIFVEALVDELTGVVSLTRVAAAYAAGRIINRELVRSQYIGGLIFGIGMALHERTVMEERSGAVLNAGLANYTIPVAADMPEFDIHCLADSDATSPTAGIKGVGMIGAVGISAAIANAVFDATGVRVRDLPITPEKILGR